ncbi:hypothetical protein ZHAS_00010232 [Anopheles sinensis]|uniref:Cyclic nucleotide-binding domain-containing protein n=1 Tax=Anopheles sinensis TaxID=74873 RepID=A0A084VX30_ANOSI|nr:hypothetical protein ZHAS_00010232 [Anopheles sinensis]
MDSDQPDAGVTSMRLGYDELRRTLKQFEYFRYWTEEQIRECSVLAQVVQYAPQQTIPMDLPLPFAYLVLSGQCMILQCLQVVREAGQPRRLLELERAELSPQDGHQVKVESPTEQLEQIIHWHETFQSRIAVNSSIPDMDTPTVPYDPDRAVAFVETPPPEQRVVHHFLDVGTFRCGAVFGLGECHQHRTIVARCRTQCLLIPRCWLFLKRQNIGNTWQRLRMYLDWQLPTRDELFDRLQSERAWLRYRRRLVRDAAKRPSRTLPADVPIICRIAESTLPSLRKPSRKSA